MPRRFRKVSMPRPENFQIDYAHPLAKGLVFFGGGKLRGPKVFYDSSLYSRHGTLTGFALPNTPLSGWRWVPELGRWGLASTNYAGVVTVSISGIAYPFGLSAWVYEPVLATANLYALRLLGGTNNSLLIYNNTIYARGKGDASAAVMVAGSWIHGYASFESDSLRKLYVNGKYLVQDTTQDTTPFVHTSTECLSFATSETPRIGSDPMIYNRILSPAEIQVLANPSDAMLGGFLMYPKRRFYVAGVAAPTTNRRRRFIALGA